MQETVDPKHTQPAILNHRSVWTQIMNHQSSTMIVPMGSATTISDGQGQRPAIQTKMNLLEIVPCSRSETYMATNDFVPGSKVGRVWSLLPEPTV